MPTYKCLNILIESDIELFVPKQCRITKYSNKNNIKFKILYIKDKLVSAKESFKYVDEFNKDFKYYTNNSDTLLLLSNEQIKVLICPDKKSIIVDCENKYLRDVYDNLLETILPVCLLNEGILTLHAACANVDNCTMAFTAQSGTGKTTLLFSLLKDGAKYISDDIISIRKRKNEYYVCPAKFLPPKMAQDSIDYFKLQDKIVRKINNSNKYYIQLEEITSELIKLDVIYILKTHNNETTIDIKKLNISESLQIILNQTIGIWGLTVEKKKEIVIKWIEVLKKVPVYQVEYKKNFDELRALTDYLKKHSIEIKTIY